MVAVFVGHVFGDIPPGQVPYLTPHLCQRTLHTGEVAAIVRGQVQLQVLHGTLVGRDEMYECKSWSGAKIHAQFSSLTVWSVCMLCDDECESVAHVL